jgi:UDP-3-O-[3-hydroxymyristoyl] glucosamine N-acyltransferase
VLHPGTVIRERCTLGARCICEPNVAIGPDGFGYRAAEGENGPCMMKIPHIGMVAIGDDVEIGAGTCIDRGKFAATSLGDGCKIDNLVQIAHNARLGRHVVIAGCSAVGGSARIGDWGLIGGAAQVRDHIEVGPRTRIGGGTEVSRDVPADAEYTGRPAQPVQQTLRQRAALKKLPDLVKRLKRT